MRLIDADALTEDIRAHCGVCGEAIECVLNAPTIDHPHNPPLTLEELRGMDLEEWLWVEVLILAAYRRTQSGYYQVHKDYTYGEAFCCGWPGTIHEFDYVDYGKTWLAYRRKPEEGTT